MLNSALNVDIAEIGPTQLEAILFRLSGADYEAIPERISLIRPIDLHASGLSGDFDRQKLEHLQVIREATRHGVAIEWHLGEYEGSLESFYHLAPPTTWKNGREKLQRWRERFLFALFYWRYGQSFVLLKDRRQSKQEKSVLVLEDPSQVSCFLQLNSVTDVSALSGDELEALEDLVELQLAFRSGCFALALPYRLTHWPVPNGMV